MKLSEYRNIATYDVGEGYFVDIIITPDNVYEAWMFHERYGIKQLMFGCDCNKETLEHFVELVETSIEDERTYYYGQHIQEED